MLMITLNKSNTALVRLTSLVLNDRDVVVTLIRILRLRRVKTWSVKNLNFAALKNRDILHYTPVCEIEVFNGSIYKSILLATMLFMLKALLKCIEYL
jgi:hypothetical protein